MTEQSWKNACAQRLISLYGYGYLDADEMAQELAGQQAERYGDVSHWMPAFAVANDGMIAMNKMRDRYLAHGKLGFTGLELRAVLDTLDLYGQLLVHCTRGQLLDALKQAEKEMRCPPQEEKEAA